MSNRPTYTQLEALVQFLEQNPGIAKGVIRSAQGKLETKRKWDEFADTANSLGVNKNGKAWAKFWADKKCYIKKICAARAASVRRTGGGAVNLPTLSALDERMVAVMGGLEFAVGESNLSVNPFPSSQVQTEEAIEIAQLPASQLQPSTSAVPDLNYYPVVITSQLEPASQPIIRSDVPQPTTPRRSPRIQARRTRSTVRTQIQIERERLARIEEKRVEAESVVAETLRTNSASIAQGIAAVQQLVNGLQDNNRELAAAVRDGCNEVARALYAVAAALEKYNK